ncbi:MAG: hypothetical protein IPI67_27120 [Myxococcales bacterium]|nr:hypothetical protein [Myxococcales bacterium]
MSATYLIISRLSPREMLELGTACERLVESYLEEHPEAEDEWGEMGAGGKLPTADEVRDGYARLGEKLAPELLDRLAECQSVFSIDHPGELEAGGLQLSIFRFLLERTQSSLLFLNDYPLETSEAFLERFASRPGAKGFGEAKAPKKRKVVRRDARQGEVRATRILGRLERAIADVRVAIDVKSALHRASPAARNYAAALMEEGAVSDAQAAKALGTPVDEVTAAADELERELFGRG